MTLIVTLIGVFLLAFILWEAFETIVLPRTVNRRVRITSLIYKYGWRMWTAVSRLLPQGNRDSFLGYFGPLSLPILVCIWALGLLTSFAMILWGLKIPVHSPDTPTFGTYAYMSGSTLFTLGFGDVTPESGLGRMISVLESGVGIGFLAAVIGYLPVLYQAFSRREINISLLDARAGTPPAAIELLKRYSQRGNFDDLGQLLRDWEQWSAELLESQLSYPVLAYYRSQHEGESWLSALTMVLDTCALIIVGVDGAPVPQAKLTFAMARHAAVDIGLIFDAAPTHPDSDRLTAGDLAAARALLAEAKIPLREGSEADLELADIRSKYEPYVFTLSKRFLLPLPNWMAEPGAHDNWQTSAWDRDTRYMHF